MLASDPPKIDDLEITLFGPGIGECALVHLGNNDWMVVDSCLNPVTKNPIAIDYLKSIGLNPASAIKLLIVSHWHADHIGGLSEITRVCPEAKISYSLALLKKEFLTIVKLFSDEKSLIDRKTASTRELADIIKELEKRCAANMDYKSRYLVPTRSDQLLYRGQMNDKNIEVRALSPSNKSIHNAFQEFAALIPGNSGFRGIVPAPTPNHNAIVLWIKFGKTAVLLGADLEETSDPLTGWSAVVNSHLRPSGKANIFKVPHHGSKSAHSDAVWKEMIDPSSIAILTTKLGGRSSIPKHSDIRRIKRYTPSVFCSNEPKHKRIKRNRTVEKTIKGVVKTRKVLGDKIGQIQVRISSKSGISVNLKEPATPI